AHRLVPELPQRLLILDLGILLDREGMAAVERPLQHLRAGVAATGQHDADHVQLVVVGGGLYPVHAQARQRVAQLGVRQAGPDDREVQRLGKLQILLRLSGCGDAASEGACARNRTSVRRSSLISGGSAVPARKLVGMGGSNNTSGSLYLFEY